jgi:NAD(P)-dependent dehydrogenase (short-subunit alcohol dehydrogenase family)
VRRHPSPRKRGQDAHRLTAASVDYPSIDLGLTIRVRLRLKAMSRVLISGSADGLGLMAARLLIADGHEVFLHARSRARGEEALLGAPGAPGLLVGDLSSIRQTRELTREAMRDLGSLITELEAGEVEKLVLTQRNRIRAVVVLIERWSEVERALAGGVQVQAIDPA